MLLRHCQLKYCCLLLLVHEKKDTEKRKVPTCQNTVGHRYLVYQQMHYAYLYKAMCLSSVCLKLSILLVTVTHHLTGCSLTKYLERLEDIKKSKQLAQMTCL